MNKQIAIIKTDGNEDAGIMTFFPLNGDQWFEDEDANTVILHLVESDDLTAAQENYLRFNDHIVSYNVTAEAE